MTENGYRFANWLYAQRETIFVVVAYFLLIILAVMIVEYSYPTQRSYPDQTMNELHFRTDHDWSSRKR